MSPAGSGSLLAKLKTLFAGGGKKDDLSRFEILGQAGKGSMSTVMKARDLERERIVALKILDPIKVHRLNARYRIARPSEGEIASSLRHPNLVRTYEYGITNRNEPFLVMEFIHGPGLSFLIETQSAVLDGRRIELLLGAARGLAHLHGLDFIHRDICPRNILIDPENTPELIDFGLTIPNTEDFHKPGNRTGTAAYMAPELIRRETTDHRVDIFSFGVTMYEMFTGRRPWEGSESLAVVVQHMNVDAKPISHINPAVPPELERIVTKSLARRPDERYQTMQNLVAALSKLEDMKL